MTDHNLSRTEKQEAESDRADAGPIATYRLDMNGTTRIEVPHDAIYYKVFEKQISFYSDAPERSYRMLPERTALMEIKTRHHSKMQRSIRWVHY